MKKFIYAFAQEIMRLNLVKCNQRSFAGRGVSLEEV